MNWSHLAFYCSIVPTIQIVLMYFLPETPAWLIRHNQVDMATENVIWLFGDDHNLITLALLTNNEAEDGSNSKLALFTEAKYRTPFLLCIVSMFYQQFSGINAIVSVRSGAWSEVCRVVMFESNPPAHRALCLPSVDLLHLHHPGRREIDDRSESGHDLHRSGSVLHRHHQLLHGRSIRPKNSAQHFQRRNGLRNAQLQFVSLSVLNWGHLWPSLDSNASFSSSRYYFLDDQTKLKYGSLPLISLLVFIFTFAIGFGPVPWLLMGELIPNRVKGLASGLVTSFNFICMFVITLEFKTLADLIDYKFIYLALSLISFSSILFHVFFLPESKGKSLAELEEYFAQRSRRSDQEAWGARASLQLFSWSPDLERDDIGSHTESPSMYSRGVAFGRLPSSGRLQMPSDERLVFPIAVLSFSGRRPLV